MSKVLIKKAEYELNQIRLTVGDLLDSIGPRNIKTGSQVVVKPNLLLPAEPEKGIVTHPMIVRAVAEYLLDKGARVQVSDSPAVGNFHKLTRVTGYNGALDGLDVTLKPFQGSVEVDIGEPFNRIPIAREAMEADVVINLAKLKTHAQMYLTLGVKNMFGCIIGLRKPEWHMRTGVEREMFARLLVQIHDAVAPAFTLIDGILAMEGQGPGKSGKPRELGLLVAGTNAHAVDKTVCTILGIDPMSLLTCREASRLGRFNGVVHVQGDIHIVDDFRFPELTSLSLGPEPLNKFMRKYVIQKPVADNRICKLCGECWKICPAGVITHNDRGVQFDYAGCIRCYCCLEVCMHAAIQAKEPLLGRIRRKLMRSG
jgi:uncharacterized protein (DUF362 family)/ferredoxin-like protein FixX